MWKPKRKKQNPNGSEEETTKIGDFDSLREKEKEEESRLIFPPSPEKITKLSLTKRIEFWAQGERKIGIFLCNC